jgi:hypothetical protein
MLRSMVGAASGVSTGDLPGKDQAMAALFLEIIHERDLWLGAARRFRDLTDLILGLPGDNLSTLGYLTPRLALTYQAHIGAELAVELIYDRVRRLSFPLVTRGTGWGVFSDLGLYFALSPDYLVLPCFHTHPDDWNELGEEMPSLADYRVLETLHKQLGGIDVCDRVVFPNGRHTLYGVDAQGRWFSRRTGQCVVYVRRQDWLVART